jgi:macrolide transport system ATP-binding/permease protein
MQRFRAWLLRLYGTFNRRSAEASFDDELASHMEFHVDEGMRSGLSRPEARRRAVLALGGVEQTRERQRDRRGWPFLESFLQDLRYGMRMLMRNRGFTIVAVLILAIGIGANTAFYSIVDATLLRPLPFADPDRLMGLSLITPAEREEIVNREMVWSFPK